MNEHPLAGQSDTVKSPYHMWMSRLTIVRLG